MIHSQTTNLLKWKIGSGTAVLVGVWCERDVRKSGIKDKRRKKILK
jgi:hypothetical protein